MALLAYTDLSPIVAMAIFSVANAINTPPYLCSLAILLGQKSKTGEHGNHSGEERRGGDETFGFAWGLWKSLMSSYQIIMYTTLGRLQDSTPGNKAGEESYQSVLLVLFVSKLAELVFGISYVVLDRRYAMGILASNEERRQEIEEEVKHSHQGARNSALLWPQRWSNWWAVIHFGASIAAAWILFFVFVVASHSSAHKPL